MIKISDHTIARMPKKGSTVLDVGSRRYGFSNKMAEAGCFVYAIEPDGDVPIPKYPNIHLIRGALVSRENSGLHDLIKWSSGDGNHLDCVHGEIPGSSTRQATRCYSIQEIMEMVDVGFWDIVKLDCEGSEYGILLEWPGPIACQITVEFHDFTGANPGGEETYKKIFSHLGQWYDVVQHNKTGLGPGKTMNYWDTLLVIKKEFSHAQAVVSATHHRHASLLLETIGRQRHQVLARLGNASRRRTQRQDDTLGLRY